MSNYNNLKSSINNNIYENQTQQITGTVLNAILNEMTNALGAGYQFAGVATVGMTPSEPDARIFYLAGEGIYTSFDGIQVPAGKLGILKWDNRWHLETIDGLGSGGANLTGYVTVASTDDLPDEGVATLGYLCGENLYLYVGEGGDTKEGKYQDCGSFRGPQGDSVQDVEQTQTSLENGGVNKIKFTLSNGISCEFQVRNGTTSSGLFPTLEALQAAYPSPVVGQYAFVGAGFPADIYVCTTAGTWTDSGEDYDGDNVDLTNYATKAEVNQLEAEVNGTTTDVVIEATSTVNKSVLRTNGEVETISSTTSVVGTYDAEGGQTYKVSGRVGTGANSCLVAFYDENGDYIDGSSQYPTAATATPYLDAIVYSPASAKTMKVAGNTSSTNLYSPGVKLVSQGKSLDEKIEDAKEQTNKVEDELAKYAGVQHPYAFQLGSVSGIQTGTELNYFQSTTRIRIDLPIANITDIVLEKSSGWMIFAYALYSGTIPTSIRTGDSSNSGFPVLNISDISEGISFVPERIVVVLKKDDDSDLSSVQMIDDIISIYSANTRLYGRNIVVLGDSSCDLIRDCWARILQKNMSKMGVIGLFAGKSSTGWSQDITTPNVLGQWNSVLENVAQDNPIVIISSGANEDSNLQLTYDQTLALCRSSIETPTSPAEWAVYTLLKIVTDRPTAKIYLVSNFYAGSTQERDARRLGYREMMRGLCDYYSITMIDLTRNSSIRGFLENATGSSGYHIYTPDGQHATKVAGRYLLFRKILGEVIRQETM